MTPAPPRAENLALLYQGLLTGIVRIRVGRQPIANADAFRRSIKEGLAGVTREAMKRNYAADHTMETDFAIVALLDEVILTSHDPCRDGWVVHPLQEELFGIATAGEVFFTRVQKLLNRHDSAELADMLEVFYLCILLGFEGQYVGQNKTELHLLADRVRQRIDRIRGGDPRFSPDAGLPQDPVAVAVPDALAAQLKLSAAAVAGLAIFLYVVAFVYLFWASSQLRDQLAKALLM